MKICFRLGFILFLIFSTFLPAKAEIGIDGSPYTYNLDFDLFGISVGLPYPWEDDSAIVGWYWTEYSQSGGHSIATLVNNDGLNTQPNAYHFGTDGDQAMGAIAGPMNGNNLEYNWEVSFFNNNFLNITNIDISFAVEQWSDNDFVPQSLLLFYRIGNNTTPGTNDWIPLSHPGLTAPHSSSLGSLDGNSLANRNLVSLTLSSTSMVINPGQRFWLRWEYPSDGVHAHPGLAIDDLRLDFEGGEVPIFGEFSRPKSDAVFKYRSKKGFKIKGKIGLVDTTSKDNTIQIKRISYATYRTPSGGTTIPSDLEFTEFAHLKLLRKGRSYRKGYRAVFKTGKRKNRAGQGLTGSAPLHMAFKVEYISSGLSNTVYLAHTFDEPEIK